LTSGDLKYFLSPKPLDQWGWLLLRVGFLCDIFELGGQEQGCLEVLRRLKRKRFKPYLYTFRAGKLIEEVRRLRIPIMVGTRKRASDPTWTLRDRRRREKYNLELAARMRKDRIDVCIIYAWKEGVTVAQQAGVRAVVERLDGFGLLARVRNKSGCQRIICQSHTIRKLQSGAIFKLGCSPATSAYRPGRPVARPCRSRAR
jgi:hypothetical protein